MAAKRPTKRRLEPGSDKVMRTGAPREAVTRISRGDAPSGDATDEVTHDDDAPLSGTRARKAAQADKADTGKRSRRASRRVTAKGTGSASSASASGRYTPPTPHYDQLPSPLWVPILMFALWGLGMLTIILNYVALVPGGETSNWYLLLGLAFILGGIITATQYR